MSEETKMWTDAIEKVFSVKLKFVGEPDAALIEGQLRYLRARLAERVSEVAKGGRPNPAEFLNRMLDE